AEIDRPRDRYPRALRIGEELSNRVRRRVVRLSAAPEEATEIVRGAERLPRVVCLLHARRGGEQDLPRVILAHVSRPKSPTDDRDETTGVPREEPRALDLRAVVSHERSFVIVRLRMRAELREHRLRFGRVTFAEQIFRRLVERRFVGDAVEIAERVST